MDSAKPTRVSNPSNPTSVSSSSPRVNYNIVFAPLQHSTASFTMMLRRLLSYSKHFTNRANAHARGFSSNASGKAPHPHLQPTADEKRGQFRILAAGALCLGICASSYQRTARGEWFGTGLGLGNSYFYGGRIGRLFMSAEKGHTMAVATFARSPKTRYDVARRTKRLYV